MKQQYEKVKVTYSSHEEMVENGFELSDEENQVDRLLYAKIASKEIKRKLTGTQRKIVILLDEGMKRSEIASHLMISVQEVHQIIARIKRRVEERDLEKEHMEALNNLVWLFHYYTNASAKKIYDGWYGDTVLKDYQRPSVITIRKWIREYGTKQEECKE